MYGYATDETKEMIPMSLELSHRLLKCAVQGGKMYKCLHACRPIAGSLLLSAVIVMDPYSGLDLTANHRRAINACDDIPHVWM